MKKLSEIVLLVVAHKRTCNTLPHSHLGREDEIEAARSSRPESPLANTRIKPDGRQIDGATDLLEVATGGFEGPCALIDDHKSLVFSERWTPELLDQKPELKDENELHIVLGVVDGLHGSPKFLLLEHRHPIPSLQLQKLVHLALLAAARLPRSSCYW